MNHFAKSSFLVSIYENGFLDIANFLLRWKILPTKALGRSFNLSIMNKLHDSINHMNNVIYDILLKETKIFSVLSVSLRS